MRYVKLEYNDYKILRNLLEDVTDRTAEETILCGKIQKICELMVEKREKLNGTDSTIHPGR